ncbi:MAG: hypothetical protein CSA55_02280 [Ilumatobacter coccineus]|uniref:DUF4244 domain-containing protein n=1 Tax=Ilumatobacter coccineus TaxID=467094 RepID=A0A2G6KBT6_9ACTN|nr:MAG: hypothetical protein CSA55_02280 [Ilumatobacter coccineus]
MLRYVAALVTTLITWRDRIDWRDDTGQATTEYALVLLAGALIGVLVIGWATAGGGAAAIGALFNRVIDAVMDQL